MIDKNTIQVIDELIDFAQQGKSELVEIKRNQLLSSINIQLHETRTELLNEHTKDLKEANDKLAEILRINA